MEARSGVSGSPERRPNTLAAERLHELRPRADATDRFAKIIAIIWTDPIALRLQRLHGLNPRGEVTRHAIPFQLNRHRRQFLERSVHVAHL